MNTEDSKKEIRCFAEINEEKTIILPNKVKKHLNEIRSDYIYILKKDYLSLYGAEYSDDLAAALKADSLEIGKVKIDDCIKLSDTAIKSLNLRSKDVVQIEMYSDGVFIRKRKT